MGHHADVQIPPLDGLRVIEGSAFVAAPSGGMTLAQLGADIIRFDQIGGGIDYRRWPLTADGESIYWAGLNKGKRSIAVDLRSDRARDLLDVRLRVPLDSQAQVVDKELEEARQLL